MSKTVYVGMSGGVDSSVSAALLQKAGYRVVGVYMKNWTQDILGYECPWREDLTDAQSAAAHLGIKLKIFDFENAYKQKVVDYMIAEYRAGRTPNPDIMCNQEVKFRLFLDAALAEGADLIATGHYAKTQNGQLLMAKDSRKDQTYFLYRVSSQALQSSLLPLSKYTKTEVRQLARQLGLPNADKPDSQGICFIGEVDIKTFLSAYIKTQPGPIKSLDGHTLGQHDGAVFYTIGQRHGLGVGGGQPYYVAGKDITTNTVYVTADKAGDELYSDDFKIADCHWINHPPEPDKTYQIRSRYRGDLIDGKLIETAGLYRVRLQDSDRAITPGQSAVVYDGKQVLGGGIITA